MKKDEEKLEKNSKYEIASLNPGWIKPQKNINKNFQKIFIFYVVNTPCTNLSASSVPLKKGISSNKTDGFKNYFFKVTNLIREQTFITTDKTLGIKKACEKVTLKRRFHAQRDVERIFIYKGNLNEIESICFHIRNSFAHGRFTIYNDDEENPTYVLEDGKRLNGTYYVRARMILKQSTLLKWIDMLESVQDK